MKVPYFSPKKSFVSSLSVTEEFVKFSKNSHFILKLTKNSGIILIRIWRKSLTAKYIFCFLQRKGVL